MCGFRNMMRRAGGCGCGRSYWATMVPRHREEIIEELEDYKAGLEAEILALEKKIKDLKAKGKGEKKE
ncbi:MAG: prefoldin subunit [Thermoproteota archaeon]|nr:prefoldin subunit [Thermoproteota archaeon]